MVAATAAAQYGQPQAGYFHDPNAQQPNWGVVDPSGYAAVSDLFALSDNGCWIEHCF